MTILYLCEKPSQARDIAKHLGADKHHGMNMTMAMSSLYGVNQILSVGRVQSPTLKLVVDRDHEIEHFKPKDYFVLKAQFLVENNTDQQNKFWTTWQASQAVIESRC